MGLAAASAQLTVTGPGQLSNVTPETLVEMVNTWRRLAPVVGRSVRPAPAPTN
jgi:hypothetical protein